jgi:SAM-dependent methyltransferase
MLAGNGLEQRALAEQMGRQVGVITCGLDGAPQEVGRRLRARQAVPRRSQQAADTHPGSISSVVDGVPDCIDVLDEGRQGQRVTVEGAATRSPKGVLRSVARTILWPLRRFFDPRFTGIHDAVQDVKRFVIADMDAANEAAVLTGRTLDNLLARSDATLSMLANLEPTQDKVEKLYRRFLFDPEAPHSLAELDETIVPILNYAASHEGFASQANLWFNPPILVAYEPHGVAVRWVNERVAEVPYVFRALSRVPPGAKVLDVGATESTVSVSLATLGYEVTAIDPRPNPLSHERLRTVVGQIEDWDGDGEFHAVLCLSTIEHLGTGEYGQQEIERRVDLEAMKRMHDLTQPGGLLVLTTAVGPAQDGRASRVYDQAGLDELLSGWNVEDLTLVQRRDETSWETVDDPIDSFAPEAETVAMVTAKKSSV